MPYLEPFKKLISGESIRGPLGGEISILCQTICGLYIYQYKQKLSPYIEQLKKLVFRAPFWGGSGEKPQKISGDKIAFAAQQIYTKITYRCCVV